MAEASMDPAQLSVAFTVKGASRATLEATAPERLRELFADAFATVVEKAAAPPAAESDASEPQIVWKRAFVTKDAGDERFVLGVVMEPESEDTQGDTIEVADIAKAQQGFMEAYAEGYGDKSARRGHMGKMHKSIVDGKVVILESYLAKQDEKYGDEVVLKDSWVIAVRVKDDAMWDEVKKGDLTGFSFGGMATRIKEKTAA